MLIRLREIFETYPEIQLHDNIVLREYDIVNDYQGFFDYYSDIRVSRYIIADEIPKTVEEAKEDLIYWHNLSHYNQGIFWAIALKNQENNRLIGGIGFHKINWTIQEAEISYDLHYDFHRKGIMTGALNIICKIAFEELRLKSIYALSVRENIASIKLLKKCGFEYSKTIEKRISTEINSEVDKEINNDINKQINQKIDQKSKTDDVIDAIKASSERKAALAGARGNKCL